MSFGFYRIHILQSLPAGELSTGRHLYRFLQDISDASDYVSFDEPETVEDFLRTLISIRDHLLSTGEIPLLHIETHGDPDGITLRSGQSLGWLQLKRILTEINIASKLNLMVVLAACHGDNLVKTMRLTDRCPMWGSIGPQTTVRAGDLLDSLQVFYKEFLHSSDLSFAFKKLNTAVAGLGWLYSLWRAEDIFRWVYERYMKAVSTGDGLEERVESILNDALQGRESDEESRSFLRTTIEAELRNHRKYFEKYKSLFFMEDLYPENRQRFTIEFSDVCNQGSA